MVIPKSLFTEEYLKDQKDLNTIPGFKNCAAFLKAIMGFEGRIACINLMASNEQGMFLEVQLPSPLSTLFYDLAGEIIGLWLIPDEGDSDQWGTLCIFPSHNFTFSEAYELPSAAGVFSSETVRKGGWVIFCDQETYSVPETFKSALDKTTVFKDLKQELDGKHIVFSAGLNLVHSWKLNHASIDFNFGPFENLLNDADIMLLANESPSGMTFTLLLKQVSGHLPEYLTKFLSLQWVTFRIFYFFAHEEFSQSSASLSAQVKFKEQDALLEVILPSNAQPEVTYSLAIYPQTPFSLKKGISDLFENLGVAAPAIPDILPALDLEMTYLRVGISSRGIDSISTSLKLKAGTGSGGWSIPKDPKIFTLNEVSLKLDWRKDSHIGFTLNGSMKAFSYDLLLSFDYPSQIISAQLAPGAQKDKEIKDLATEMGFPSELANGLNDVGTALSIFMYADVKNKRREIRIRNHEAWKLADNTKLNTLDLQIKSIFENDWRFSEASLYAELDLPIGPVKGSGREPVIIDIEADYNRYQNIWSFKGETGVGQNIAVGEAINALSIKVGGSKYELPEAIQSLVVRNIHLLFDNKGNAEFTCMTSLDVNGNELDFWVHLKREQTGEFLISGSLFINGIQLGVAFESKLASTSDSISASASERDSTPVSKPISDKYIIGSLLQPLTLDSKDLISAIAPRLAPNIPLSVAVKLKSILLGLHKGKSSEFLFRLSFDLNIDLKGIPLVGDMLPAGIGFTNGHLLAANKDWKDEDIAEVNGLLGQFQPNQPEALVKLGDNSTGPTVGKGISLSGSFQISELEHFPMFLHFGGDTKSLEQGSGKAETTPDTQPNASSGDNGQIEAPKTVSAKPDPRAQRQVGKHLGPVNFKKVEMIFQDGRLGLKITGGLALAAFEFELMGLSVTVPQTVLKDPSRVTEIVFDLDGIGIDVQKGTLTIAATFLRTHYEASGSIEAYDEYNGIVQVAFPPFSLTGMGSYANYDGHPSLFLFVAIGFPITVHPSLIIEGMSLGFGVHRDFIAPKVNEILSFPLIQASVTPPPPMDIATLVESMHKYFPPTVDQYFVVAGIKFKALGLVDTLALLAVKFGREFEIDLIGVSSITLPGGFIELAWMARVLPDKGEFLIRGELTDRSFILVPAAQLTGGFAVAFWTKDLHKGDFVVSVGGYHPQFKSPDHYPDHISRLGISFKLGTTFAIKGGAYFAVTPQAIMMGGYLSATLTLGDLQGYLNIALDVMIWYQPFHYDALIGVDAGVKIDIPAALFTIHINLHLHLDVHVWGPDFSGTAYLDLGIKTFSVPFGAGSSAKALPVGWDEFKGKFLSTSVCSAAVTKGLIRKVKKADNTEVYVINPKELEIEAKTTVPITEKIDGTDAPGSIGRFGITPMGVPGEGYTATFEVTIKKGTDISNGFKKAAITNSVPAAIWGVDGLTPPDLAKSDSSLLKNALTGVLITPGAGRESGETHEMDKETLAYDTDEFEIVKASSIKYSKLEDQKFTSESPIAPYSEFTGLTGLTGARTIDMTKLLHKPILVSLNK